MSDTSPILSLPYIQPSQAQKHVTHNEAIRMLDSIVQLTVRQADRRDPPVIVTDGDRYIVPLGGTRAWAGKDTKIAQSENGAWTFITPATGWLCYVSDTQDIQVFDGAAWGPATGGLVADDLNNLPGVGINTTADTANKLAVSSNATLFSHAGNGHQLKLNKNSAADTASLLFQSNWSGHAEMGLAGSTDFSIKVSDDGGTWFTGLAFDASTGAVQFPSGGVRRQLTADMTLYVDPASGDDANAGNTSDSPLASLAQAVQVAFSVDAGGHVLRIQLADGTYALSAPVYIDQPIIGTKELEILGNPIAPENVVLSSAAEVIVVSAGNLKLSGMTLEATGSGACLDCKSGAQMTLNGVNFGTGGMAHINLDHAHCTITGDYAINGAAAQHVKLTALSSLKISAVTVTINSAIGFSDQFMGCFNGSFAELAGTVFSGSATGQRYNCWAGGIINTNSGGATYLPGDSAGTASANGIYV
ncbi:DUF2793 domain-containing protein [Parasulfitobacter algicola]|uniref:DUF2793 domain-containing protein n=1 Tax=Parasulfitobacter algicola TaxID=2614809 RepID=A0ABX2IZC5_9RHOB|nr:DUF2793 domain-containing protein [Sulfitobacter algicola]NSX56587.1 DUF2793 domain-containing protein [Sulfitobacter algicola]